MILTVLGTPTPLLTAEPQAGTTDPSGDVQGTPQANIVMRASGPGGSAPTDFAPAEKLILFGFDVALPAGIDWRYDGGWGEQLPWYTIEYFQGGVGYQIPNLGYIPFDGLRRENLPAYGIALDPREVIGSGFDITLPYSLRISAGANDPFMFRMKPDITDLIDATVGVDIYTDWFINQTLAVIGKMYVGHTNPMIP